MESLFGSEENHQDFIWRTACKVVLLFLLILSILEFVMGYEIRKNNFHNHDFITLSSSGDPVQLLVTCMIFVFQPKPNSHTIKRMLNCQRLFTCILCIMHISARIYFMNTSIRIYEKENPKPEDGSTNLEIAIYQLFNWSVIISMLEIVFYVILVFMTLFNFTLSE